VTDYRLRNHDLLYAPRGKRPLDRRSVAIFALIAAVVTFGVATHLAEKLNAATPGRAVARQPASVAPVQLATPRVARPGS
jgi:hypothetical protein